jgi:hypothetical protein
MSTVIRSALNADELNQWFAGIDAANEADPGAEHAGEDVLAAGQAAVDALNASRAEAAPGAYVKRFPGRTTTMTVTAAEGRALVQSSYSDDAAPGPVYRYPSADPERTVGELGEQLIANGYTRADES